MSFAVVLVAAVGGGQAAGGALDPSFRRGGKVLTTLGTVGEVSARGVIAFASERGDGAPELYTMNPQGGSLRRLTVSSPEPAGPVVWTPNGRTLTYLAYAAVDEAIWTVGAQGGKVRPLVQHISVDSDSRGLSWSPDGRLLVVATDAGLRLFDPVGRPVRLLAKGGGTPAWSPNGKLIAFTDGGTISTIRPDGTGRRRLGEGTSPAWSPDSKRLVVEREGSDIDHLLFVMNADGSGQRRLVTDDCSDNDPAWSSKDEIAFDSICSDASNALGILSRVDAVRPDGSGRRTVVREGARGLAWSPDGTRLALAGGNIVVVGADGSGSHTLLTRPGGDSEPAWSKDGKLAFERGELLSVLRNGRITEVGYGFEPSWAPDGRRLVVSDENGDLVVVDIATRKSKIILEHTGAGDPEKDSPDWSLTRPAILFTYYDDSTIGIFDVRRMQEGDLRVKVTGSLPAWAPDGTRFAYTSGEIDGGGGGISVARADGSGQKRITRTGYHPTWSPDGKQIAFVRNITPTNPEIFVINADGTGERRLTHHPGYDSDPAWSRN